ncbi:hypothetical protein cyc_02440 [Cyclospora cayetanensis]|uniref:Secreted protein n=1 Tax=Cyclospora cayetanensis TaxID=88456 RepID=A0A1D3D8T8_9EIME|nr:hypothetical protein cyc_02440 [Cyclospora cayetanensis]
MSGAAGRTKGSGVLPQRLLFVATAVDILAVAAASRDCEEAKDGRLRVVLRLLLAPVLRGVRQRTSSWRGSLGEEEDFREGCSLEAARAQKESWKPPRIPRARQTERADRTAAERPERSSAPNHASLRF